MGMSGVGPSELVVILLIALLLFGSKRLKTLGGDVGDAIRSFRAAMHGSVHETVKLSARREPEPTLAASPAGSVGAPARSPTASAPAPQDAPHLD